ncbi:MAG: hypothetical protein B6D54_03485 [Epsilonproteobacteria bacterium 4484_65]|nr:MAG: hypothetical protein B6D54_03485 [Epsilonproteobacteria bacterium 4484_65]HEC45681.1 hypothetical protein [Campylobacterota bacterium]
MKKVEVVKPSEVEVTPFVLQDFTAKDTETVSSELVSKKELKLLAKELGLAYDDEHIAFTKKLINAYMKKR